MYRISKCAIVIAALVGAVGVLNQVDAAMVFLGTPTFTTTRTDAYGEAGFGFYSNSGTAQVNELGFYVDPSDSSGTGKLAINHTLALYDYNGNTWTELAQATVLAGASADSSGYTWALLPSTLTLTDTRQNADFYVVVASFGTDVWGPNTGSSTHTSNAYFGTPTGDGLAVGASAVIGPVGSTVAFQSAGVDGGFIGPNIGLVAVPEPASIGLIGLAAIATLVRRRRQVAELM